MYGVYGIKLHTGLNQNFNQNGPTNSLQKQGITKTIRNI